jgi:hypothetical protein
MLRQTGTLDGIAFNPWTSAAEQLLPPRRQYPQLFRNHGETSRNND